MRRASAGGLLCLGALAACQSGARTHADLVPHLRERIEQLTHARDEVLLWSGPPRPIQLGDRPLPRFCHRRVCRSDEPDGPRVNARVVELERLEQLGELPRVGMLRVGGGSEWLDYGYAFATGDQDPTGRPVWDWYGPTLQEMAERLVGLRYVLVVRSAAEWTPWVEVDPSHHPPLLEWSVEGILDPREAGQSRLHLSGTVRADAFLFELTTPTLKNPKGIVLLGGVRAVASTEGEATEVVHRAPGDREAVVRDRLARATRRQLRARLAESLPPRALPFTDSGDLWVHP